MKKFMKMEDNTDGTTTIELCFDGEGRAHSFIMMMSIDDFMGGFVSQLVVPELINDVADTFIMVPTTTEGASND